MTNQVELDQLIALFYAATAELGSFVRVLPAEMPEAYRRLLAHSEHMTVKVEEFHHDRVDVEVLNRHKSAEHYSRTILLRRQRDHRVVQFGIPRLRLDCVSQEVRQEIEAEKIPLGRVLIEHNVLREVELLDLWRVNPGPALVKLFEVDPPFITYGRTALIRCEGKPAVELLEIVAPVERF